MSGETGCCKILLLWQVWDELDVEIWKDYGTTLEDNPDLWS